MDLRGTLFDSMIMYGKFCTFSVIFLTVYFRDVLGFAMMISIFASPAVMPMITNASSCVIEI